AVLDPRAGRLARALNQDAPWADRGCLVLGRIDGSTARRLTDQGFVLAPATPEGMRVIGQYIASSPRESGEVLQALPGVAAARPRIAPRAARPRNEYDYVVIGSGAGGGKVAARPPEARYTVLLVEAGGGAPQHRRGGAPRPQPLPAGVPVRR